ncbi:hypothetical protein PYW08_010461 [Mythimna loreyi]|uniref:Uncharacterized protein n=1 Tax=Mythimna loreyi TaxID=667449 RepID=A0ACC2Q4I9_9NEOP|nr:hypothetical protein PYW08_010461 [Mythimna loreyi]
MYRTQCVLAFLALHVGLIHGVSWEQTRPLSIGTNSINYEVKSGENVILECKANPEIDFGVSWYKNNQHIFIGPFNLLHKERYSIVNDKNLMITNAEIEDSGVFVCKTMIDSVVFEHNLLVTEAPVIRNITATNGGYIAENTDLLLTCNITASPRPSVVWSVSKMDQNRNLNEKDAEFQVNGTIYSAFIKNVKRENTGKYLCYAFNSIGLHQAEINVVVSGNSHTSNCEAGYSGDMCDVRTCDGYCLNNGICSLNKENNPVCECTADYRGTRCNVTITKVHGDNKTEKQPQDLNSKVSQAVGAELKRFMKFFSNKVDEYVGNM